MRDHPTYSHDEEETGHIMNSGDDNNVWRVTGIAAVASLVINIVLYFIGRSAGWIPDDMPDSTETFSLVSVILASVVPVILFGVLMSYLAKNAPRASRLFTIILLVVLIIAVMVPFTLRDIESSFQFTLLAMHIVTAGSILLLTQTAQN